MTQSVRHVPRCPHRRQLSHDLPRRFSLRAHLVGATCQLGLIDLFFLLWPEHDHYLPARRFGPEMLREPGHRPAPELFELFRQLAGHCARALPRPGACEIVQRCRDAAGRFVQHACVRRRYHLGDRISPLSTSTREKAEEGESVRPQSRAGEGGEKRRSAGDRDYVEA